MKPNDISFSEGLKAKEFNINFSNGKQITIKLLKDEETGKEAVAIESLLLDCRSVTLHCDNGTYQTTKCDHHKSITYDPKTCTLDCTSC